MRFVRGADGCRGGGQLALRRRENRTQISSYCCVEEVTFSRRSIQAWRSKPKSMNVHWIPSRLYSSCSRTNIWWLKNCCSFSFVKLIHSCSKLLNWRQEIELRISKYNRGNQKGWWGPKNTAAEQTPSLACSSLNRCERKSRSGAGWCLGHLRKVRVEEEHKDRG